MDAVLFISFTIVVIFLQVLRPSKEDVKTSVESELVVEDTDRVAKLNDSFYEDTNAFSEIINALGFPKGGF